MLADEGGFDDPYHHLQHGSAAMRTGAAQRWATGRGVRIAVIDTGVEIDHPDLTGRIVGARNFVDRGEVTFTSDRHGTSVAGVIAAVANNGEGIVGVAPDAGILALKACWPVAGSAAAARCDSYTLALAIDFAIQEEVEILNMSLAGPEDPLLALLVGKAIERGIVVVAARDDRASGAGAFPASLEGVISIGLPKDPAGGSGALVAPGTDVLTTVPRHSYDFLSGSSFAAAHASGVVALLLERNRALAPVEVADLLGQSLRWGRRSATVDEVPVIDACAAIGRLMRRQDCLDSVVAVEER